MHEDLEPDGQGGYQVSETRFGHGDLIDSTQMQTDESGAAADLNGAGGGTGPVSYTAFGEAVGVGGWGEGGAGDAGPVGDGSLHDELDTRYRFAGGYGYESAGGAAGSPAGGYGAALLALPGAWGWGASGSGYCGANQNLPPITLQHLGWRWYQADSGRFVQRDPIGIRGGWNVYGYCWGNPLSAADATGLVPPELGYCHGCRRWICRCGERGPLGPRERMRSDPELSAEDFLNLTGGNRCWLDNRPLVKKVEKTCNVIALVCSAPVSPWPLVVKLPILLAGGITNVWY